MKKFRFALPVLALVLAVATSAFKSKEKPATAGRWYIFSGSSYSLAQLQDAANYSNPDDVQPCDGESNLCAIFYEEDNVNPQRPEDFDAGLQAKIADFFNNGSPDVLIAQQP